MADNLVVTPGVGATIRMIEKSGIKAQTVTIDLGGAGAESLLTGSMPVKSNGFSVQADLTVDAGAYSIGDAMGTVMTFASIVSANGKSSIINSITLAPNDAMTAIPFNLWLLNADLATPIAKNAAFTYVAADATKILAVIPIVAADYVPSQNSWNVAHLRGVGTEFKAGGATTSIYAYLVATAVTAPVATHLYITLSGEFID